MVHSVPTQGQTGVSLSTPIMLTFNTCLEFTSVSSANVTLIRGTTSQVIVPAQVALSASLKEITVTPSQALVYGATYSVALGAGLRSQTGATLAKNSPGLIFRTRSSPDTVPPVTTAAPVGGTYRSIQTVTLACTDNPGGTGCANTYFTTDDTTPTSASSKYAGPLTVDRSMQLRYYSTDVDGNAEGVKSQTYVIDLIPPTVAVTAPATNATGVRVDSALVATFSEPMQATTVTASVVSISPALPFTASYQTGPATLSITPGDRLACGTVYTVTIAGSVMDVAGNSMGTPYAWQFTTSSDCDPPRTTASLDSGTYGAPQTVTLTCADGTGSGCARIVYTLDETIPRFSPVNGTVVEGASAGPIAVPAGFTRLRYRAIDRAGNEEMLNDQRYHVSSAGFTWVAAWGGLFRGAGTRPVQFEQLGHRGIPRFFSRDPRTGRLWMAGGMSYVWYTDDGLRYHEVEVKGANNFFRPDIVAADGSRIYAASSDGLSLSADGGASWSVVPLGSYDSQRVLGMALVGGNVYLATERGIVVSNDGFRTFTRVGTTSMRTVKVNRSSVYALSADGRLQVSNDAGATWSTPLDCGVGAGYSLAADGDNVYVGGTGGIAISRNRGVSFTQIHSSMITSGTWVGLLAASAGRVYAWVMSSTGVAPSYYVSADSGGTFTRTYMGGGTRDVRANSVFAEGATVHVGGFPSYFKSTDGGLTFKLADLPGSSYKRIAGNAGTLYAATASSSGWNGLVKSTDGFKTFSFIDMTQGLPDGSINDLYVDGTKLYVATSFAVSISSDGGATWNQRTSANSGLGSNPSHVRASGTAVWVASSYAVHKSTDGGTSFTSALSPTGLDYAFEMVGSTLLYLMSDGIHVSTNSGTSFTLRGASNGLGTLLRDAAITSSGRIYVTNGDTTWGSSDGGANFTAVTMPASYRPYILDASGSVLHLHSGSTILISSDDMASTFETPPNLLPQSSVKQILYVAP